MLVALLFVIAQAPRETAAPPRASERVLIKAAHLIDGRSDLSRDKLAVLVEGERIAKIGPPGELQTAGVKVIDLGDSWLLPGLIDAHTHLLLQGDITAVRTEALARRAR